MTQGDSNAENFKSDFKINSTERYLELKYLKHKDGCFIVKIRNKFPKQMRGWCVLLVLAEIILKVKTTKNKGNHCKKIARTFPHMQKVTNSKTRFKTCYEQN